MRLKHVNILRRRRPAGPINTPFIQAAGLQGWQEGHPVPIVCRSKHWASPDACLTCLQVGSHSRRDGMRGHKPKKKPALTSYTSVTGFPLHICKHAWDSQVGIMVGTSNLEVCE